MSHTRTDPATLRALAARVMAGDEFPQFGREIATAMDQPPWRFDRAFLRSLDDADLLMAPLRERGWEITIKYRLVTTPNWRADASHWDYATEISGGAATGARTITALALLCRAAELDRADADQR